MDDLLARQLQQLGLSPQGPPADPGQWSEFLEHVDRAYAEHRQDKVLLERTMEVSSQEMQRRYEDLRTAADGEVAGERDRLRAIIDGFSDGFCILDAEGRSSSVNSAGAALLGLAPDQHEPDLLRRFAIGCNPREPDGLSVEKLVAEVRSGRTVRDGRARLRRADGSDLPVSILLFPIVEGGGITGAALAFQDMTEFRKSERTRQRLAMAVKASADAIYITDSSGVIEYVNPAFTATTGLEAAQAIGQRTSILKSGRTEPEVYRNLWSTIVSGRVWRGRLVNKRLTPAGERVYWAQTTIAPIRDSDDRPAGYVAVQRDVTAEVELEEMHLLETYTAEVRARVAQILLGEEALAARLSAAVATLGALPGLGYAGPALIAVANDSHGVDTPMRQGEVPEGLAQALCNQRRKALTPQYRKDLGGLVVPIPHAGNIAGALWLAASEAPDLSAAEEDVLRLLAGMIGIAIADDQARRDAEQARQAALDAAEAKARFLANMSHEIRTPMNGVLGMLEMLSQTPMNAEQLDYLQTAHGSADSLLTIINDILDYSKIEAGKLDLEHIPFDVRRLVEEVTTLFHSRAVGKGLELACYVPLDAATHVVGDPTRLRQVLGNILGNAIKFTRRGEVVLRVAELDRSKGRTRLRLEVEDTGVGMTVQERRRLFQPFVQADGSTTRRFGGTGLGLAICKQLVELMGGDIGAESEPGKGSCFWFAIPFESQTTGNDTGVPQGLAGARILAVDDNASNLTILGHYLTSWEVQYASATSGFEALALLREAARQGRAYEVALVDMQMPELDGLTLGRMIKSDPEIAGTRLMMLSSIGQTERQLKESGFVYALTKPIRQAVLHEALLRIRESGSSPQPPAAAQAAVATAAPVQAPIKPPLRGRVLLAEDNLINQRVAVGMLTRLGLQVEVAANGSEALDRLGRAPYDLVLMDCEMPVLDGFEATRCLRADREARGAPHLPVIALTANAMTGDRERCLDAGMDDYLPKPIKLNQLREALSRWLPSAAEEEPNPDGPRSEADREPVIELERLTTLGQCRDEELLQLLDRFENRSGELVEAIADAIAQDAADALGQAARDLKMSAANLGAGRVCELAGRLETLAAERRLAEADAELAAIRSEHVRALAALADVRADVLSQGEGPEIAEDKGSEAVL